MIIMEKVDLTPVWKAFGRQASVNRNHAIFALATTVVLYIQAKQIEDLEKEIKRLKRGEGD